MSQDKDEFKQTMEAQLSELHRRIAELAELQPHAHEHAISWDTVVGDCRKRHEAMVGRMERLGHHADAAWHAERREVEEALSDLRDTVERHEKVAG